MKQGTGVVGRVLLTAEGSGWVSRRSWACVGKSESRQERRNLARNGGISKKGMMARRGGVCRPTMVSARNR